VEATLLDFSRVNDAAAATRSKLRKLAILAEYLTELAEDDLRLAVRFCAGRAFPATDERVLNVGGAVVGDVVVDLLGIEPSELWEAARRWGEIGEAVGELWGRRSDAATADGGGVSHGTASQALEKHAAGQSPVHVGANQHRLKDHARHGALTHSSPGVPGEGTEEAPLGLWEIAEVFEELSRTGRGEVKRRILHVLFSRCRDLREVAYLAKIIFRDMRTGVQEGVLQAAVAHAFGVGLMEIRRCQFMVGDLEEAAVLAKRGRLDEARFRLFHPVPFMLAQPKETAEEAAAALGERAFYIEDKLDGIRAQVHKTDTPDGARIAIYTRTMDRADESFPDVVEKLREIPGEFLLDGEIVPWCDGCVLPFAHIQRRLGRKALTRTILAENPAVFMAFDILYRDGALLVDRPLRERRRVLEELIPHGLLCVDAAEVSTTEQIERAFAESRARRNEGVVLKDPESVYAPGRRGGAWLKLKTHLPTFDCVVTVAEYGHGRRRGVLSDYTFAVWDLEPAEPDAHLVNVGKAYSGVTDAEIAQLTELFLKLSRRSFGGGHVVEPRVVLEIACDQIQRSTRHASGYALRFPRIKRIRWDKQPEEAERLERIIEIYRSTHNFGRPARESPPPAPTLFDGLV
jgi:DNA ligase 1